MRVAVLGGGIAGLAAAWKLLQGGHTPIVFEAADVPGGKIRSVELDGYLLELGPHAILPSYTALYNALDGLGLTDQYLPGNPEGTHRFICLDGRPEPLPMGLGALIKTPLLTGRAKWRLLKEPFIAKMEGDESVADFFTRRLGPEVVTRLIDPFISGVYAGDPAQLSMAAAFPVLKELEREGGSLFKGGLARMRKTRKQAAKSGDFPKPKGGMYAFKKGLQELPLALARALGDNLRLGTPIKELSPAGDRWRVNGETFEAVVSTIPVPDWAALGAGVYPQIKLEYATVAVAHLSYPREAVKTRTDGFGMLIPAVEKRRILGLLFDSSLFPGRAPEGEHLFTIFLGGQRNRWIKKESPESLLGIAHGETADLMGIGSQVKPALSHLHIWEHAIPQYGFQYADFLQHLQKFEASHPNWAFAGSYRQGISVGHSFESGLDAAQRLADRA
ncbi:MAG: protoporphyrinogen oxidase [Candidatus Marinimicrobia bacterium]|nr:protoporphyrinogen oxidase [Candidatus Neomarinimicrobiota bacterium]